jgi:hypothetical protein
MAILSLPKNMRGAYSGWAKNRFAVRIVSRKCEEIVKSEMAGRNNIASFLWQRQSPGRSTADTVRIFLVTAALIVHITIPSTRRK